MASWARRASAGQVSGCRGGVGAAAAPPAVPDGAASWVLAPVDVEGPTPPAGVVPDASDSTPAAARGGGFGSVRGRAARALPGAVPVFEPDDEAFELGDGRDGFAGFGVALAASSGGSSRA